MHIWYYHRYTGLLCKLIENGCPSSSSTLGYIERVVSLIAYPVNSKSEVVSSTLLAAANIAKDSIAEVSLATELVCSQGLLFLIATIHYDYNHTLEDIGCLRQFKYIILIKSE